MLTPLFKLPFLPSLALVVSMFLSHVFMWSKQAFFFSCPRKLFLCLCQLKVFVFFRKQALSVWSENRPAYVKTLSESMSYLSLSRVPPCLLECWLFSQYPIVDPQCRVPVCTEHRTPDSTVIYLHARHLLPSFGEMFPRWFALIAPLSGTSSEIQI